MRRQHPCCRAIALTRGLTPSSIQYRASRLAYEACIYEKSLPHKGITYCPIGARRSAQTACVELPDRCAPALRPAVQIKNALPFQALYYCLLIDIPQTQKYLYSRNGEVRIGFCSVVLLGQRLFLAQDQCCCFAYRVPTFSPKLLFKKY